MTVSTRTRFEVFKRDRFTCAYCGRTPPEVLLHADHVVPRAAGGSDEIHNLITSCQTCNQGKAARLLEEGTSPVVGRGSVEDLQERIDQAKAYMEAVVGLQAVQQDQVQTVMNAWAKAYGAEVEKREDGTYWVFRGYGRWPEERSIRRILRQLPLDQVLDAVDITAGYKRNPNDEARRYFYGVCQRKIKDRESADVPLYALDSQEVRDLLESEYIKGHDDGSSAVGGRVHREIGPHRPTGIVALDEALDRLLGPVSEAEA
jgi:hypothetical protein